MRESGIPLRDDPPETDKGPAHTIAHYFTIWGCSNWYCQDDNHNRLDELSAAEAKQFLFRRQLRAAQTYPL